MDRRHWSDGLLAVLDTETTGVDVTSDRIVQIALLYVAPDGSSLWPSWNAVVDPGIEIPEAASRVHGLTTAEVRRRGVTPVSAMHNAARTIDTLAREDRPLVIFNAPFDWPLLCAECRRHGVREPRRPLLIDPLAIDRGIAPKRPGSRTLSALCTLYRVEWGAAHTAVGDALGAVALARALAREHPVVRDTAPADLQFLQARWHRAWAEDINAYWARRGEDRRADPRWPWGPLDPSDAKPDEEATAGG